MNGPPYVRISEITDELLVPKFLERSCLLISEAAASWRARTRAHRTSDTEYVTITFHFYFFCFLISKSHDTGLSLQLSFIYIYYKFNWGRDSAVGIATRYGLDGPGISNPGERRDFPQPSRPVLGSNQPHIQWVPGLSRG